MISKEKNNLKGHLTGNFVADGVVYSFGVFIKPLSEVNIIQSLYQKLDNSHVLLYSLQAFHSPHIPSVAGGFRYRNDGLCSWTSVQFPCQQVRFQ